MFAETAIVAYRQYFTDQGKQTSVFRFRLQQTNRSSPLLFSVCSKQQKLPFSVSFHVYKIYIYMETAAYMNICCHSRQKTEAQAIILNPFTVPSMCK
jgi:hypothetical protein